MKMKKIGDAWEIEWMCTMFFYHDGEPNQWSLVGRPNRDFKNSKHASYEK